MKKLLLILLLATVVSCSAPPAAPPLKIVFQSDWTTTGIAFIAQEKGLFTKHGVQVTLMPVRQYLDSLTLYKEGKADMVFAVLADALTFEAEGLPSRMVYATDYSDTGDVIVGQPTLNSLSDLKGKKVSFEGFNTFSHLLVLKLLEKAGILEGEFQAASLTPTEVLEALETGKIQAGHVYGSPAATALDKGYKILGKAGDVPYLVTETLVVNAETVNSRHQDVQGVVNALIEAMDWLQRFPEDGIGIIAKHSGIQKAELDNTLKGMHVFTLQESQAIFNNGGTLFKKSQEIIDFFYQKGVLVKIPDLNAVIDGQFVNATRGKP